ncbi:hypothetical protein WKW80_09230 [Variovorax humicola]|uniref:Uncharacterized protein n=1 Tax=Variovorax humicola TaxID=1769758 RepID=A0ABU8VWN1_9BURK
MDMSLVQAGIASVKALQDIVKLGIDAKVDAKSSERVVEALGKLGEVADALYVMRDELFRLQTENDKLKREADRRLAFETRKAAYELTKTAGGAFVWGFKGEPAHYACPNCMNDDRIEILQDNRVYAGTYRCTVKKCEATFPVDPEPERSPRARRSFGFP